jgi:hypothetical protein
MTENPFEIPQTLRDLTEQNMKQAHAAYEQLAHFMIKAIDAWMSATPSNSMVTDFNLTGFEDVQNRTVAMATKNADSAFVLLTLQTQFAQEQMQAYAAQTQELQWLIWDAFYGGKR